MRSSGWLRSGRPAMKGRSKRFSWAGRRSFGRHMTRLYSALTKESRHLTFAGSTPCWSPEAWTDLCACGTHISQGEESHKISGLPGQMLYFPFSFSRKPTAILRGHCAPISYLCTSSEDSQIFSVSTDNTVKVIFPAFTFVFEISHWY